MKKEKNLTIKDAWKSFWVKAFQFSGTATRFEFWVGVLASGLISLILVSFFLLTNSEIFGMIFMLWVVVISLPTFSLSARRLQNIGISGSWVAIFPLSRILAEISSGETMVIISGIVGLIAFIGWILLGCLKSDFIKPNKYRNEN